MSCNDVIKILIGSYLHKIFTVSKRRHFDVIFKLYTDTLNDVKGMVTETTISMD